ncbi:DNA-3-methyladenine glycosylase family protein [Phreatobacter sp.]|uniref:DNA-3-methyladenine glycosylase family protein n=1 Tax=Phreatobacter sp. TaxID=1966341 RepID=UPI003F7264E4
MPILQAPAGADAMTSPPPCRIDSEADLDAALRALGQACPLMAGLHAQLGAPPLRRRPPGLAGLAHIVVFQQISTGAARVLWARMEQVFGAITAERLAGASDEDYRAAGQSRPKVRTLRAVAEAVRDGSLDLDTLAAMEADAAHALLVKVKGIGPWTADVYLLSCLGHADAWPAGDIALQQAAADLLGLGARPDAKAMAAIGERWRPFRAVAARLLWAAYGARRQGRIAEPVPV